MAVTGANRPTLRLPTSLLWNLLHATPRSPPRGADISIDVPGLLQPREKQEEERHQQGWLVGQRDGVDYVHPTQFIQAVAVFADEAHIYLSDGDPSCEAARRSAERIAKEGRKYGISLTVISQRPRELSSTILSQCGSFLCLRISNPDDQSYVRNLLPDSVRGITSMFSTLRRGEAILLGDSVMMPTRIRIARPDPQPQSDDASFGKSWKAQPADLDVDAVLAAWRAQAV